MDLRKLFKMQFELDDHIIREKGLEGRNLIPNTILALQVELGELANEWQGFKHWKVEPQPKPRMLEEYVDCLHFFLSLGLQKYFSGAHVSKFTKYGDITRDLSLLITTVGSLDSRDIRNYENAFSLFLGIGELLGFTWEQIEQAYLEKNQVNHERQENGY